MAALDVTQLRYFQAIARHASLTRAAAALGVTQPALTASLRRLETALRTTLFVRTREGVAITATGDELLHHADGILAAVGRAEEAVLGLETGDRGRFVVGCPESLGLYFLPAVVVRVARELPRVELAVVTARSRDVERAVVRREVHFGIVARPLPHPDLVLVDLFRDRTGLFARRSAKAPRTGAAAARRLLREGPLLYADGLPQAQEMLSRLDELGLVPERRLPCGSLELVKSLVAAGVGVGVLPERVACHASQAGQRAALSPLPASLPSIPDVIRLVYRGDSHRTRALARLKDILVECARELAEG
jgi:DNA-binding transcriptional LysR family regulator